MCRGKDELLAAKQLEIVATERALSEEKQRVSSMDEECAALKGRLEGKTEEIGSLQADNRSLKVQLYNYRKGMSCVDSMLCVLCPDLVTDSPVPLCRKRKIVRMI